MDKNFVDYYSILHVGQKATKKTIKTAFYKLNRTFKGKKNSTEWRTIYKAFTVLSNDEERAIYDRSYNDNKTKKQNMIVVKPDRYHQLEDISRLMHQSSYNNSENFYFNQYGEVVSNELFYGELGWHSIGWNDGYGIRNRQLNDHSTYNSLRNDLINQYENVLSNELIYDELEWRSIDWNDGYDPDFDYYHKNKRQRGEKSNNWKYFRNFGLICVGADCLTFALRNDSATVWTVIGRCMCGVSIIYISWGCGKVIYTICKWILVRLYDLCALIYKTLWFITTTSLKLCLYCVAIVLISPCLVIYTIYRSVLKIYNLGALIVKKLLYMPDKKDSTYFPPLVKGSLILLSLGSVVWGLTKLFR